MVTRLNRKYAGILSLFVTIALCFAGCSGNPSDAGLSPGQDIVLTSGGGVRVTVHAGSLSRDANVILAAHPPGAVQFPSAEFVALGEQVRLQLGYAQLVGPITIEAPLHIDAASAIIHVTFNGVSVPLDTVIDSTRNIAIASFDVTDYTDYNDNRSLQISGFLDIGLLDSSIFEHRVAHIDWPAWNAYIYTTGGGTEGQNDFVKFIDQGQVISTPDLGSRPLLLVHGLGGAIHDGELDELAEFMRINGSFSSILGFEYDTLASVERNGAFLRQAIALLNTPPFRDPAQPQRQWFQVAFSMGTLVTRTAFEKKNLPPLDIQKANVVLICSPSLGSQAAIAMQELPPLSWKGVFKYLVLNNHGNWINADGTPCTVTSFEAGFTDMRPDSQFIAQLNLAVEHPQADYRVLAGGTRLLETELLDAMLKVWLTDGLVDLDSATTPLMKFIDKKVLTLDDHFAARKDPKDCFPSALGYLNQ
jgi:hypothetical protein